MCTRVGQALDAISSQVLPYMRIAAAARRCELRTLSSLVLTRDVRGRLVHERAPVTKPTPATKSPVITKSKSTYEPIAPTMIATACAKPRRILSAYLIVIATSMPPNALAATTPQVAAVKP